MHHFLSSPKLSKQNIGTFKKMGIEKETAQHQVLHSAQAVLTVLQPEIMAS